MNLPGRSSMNMLPLRKKRRSVFFFHFIQKLMFSKDFIIHSTTIKVSLKMLRGFIPQ